MTDFSNASLVLLGHGTALNPGSEKPVFQHAAEIRKRRVFGDVREAFWKQMPYAKEVLAELTTPRVFIVPFFLSAGYFSGQVIPTELGLPMPDENGVRTLKKSGQVWHYTRPVGLHAGMTEIVLARVLSVLEHHPFPRRPALAQVSLFLAGHGTERNQNSRQPAEREVDRIRELGRFASVHAVYLEETPRIEEVYSLATTRNIVVAPYFLSEGLHVQEHVPVLLGERQETVRERLRAGRPPWRNPTERKGSLVWYARSLGSEPMLAEVILRLVAESCQ